MSEADEAMTGVHGGESRLPLSEDETKVLELYDRLQELRLEIAIINAQQAGKKSHARRACRCDFHDDFAHPTLQASKMMRTSQRRKTLFSQQERDTDYATTQSKPS